MKLWGRDGNEFDTSYKTPRENATEYIFINSNGAVSYEKLIYDNIPDYNSLLFGTDDESMQFSFHTGQIYSALNDVKLSQATMVNNNFNLKKTNFYLVYNSELKRSNTFHSNLLDCCEYIHHLVFENNF